YHSPPLRGREACGGGSARCHPPALRWHPRGLAVEWFALIWLIPVLRHHRIGWMVLAAALTTAPAALAQQPGNEGGNPPTPPAAADPQSVKDATALFTRGSELYAKKKYAEALGALQASHK